MGYGFSSHVIQVFKETLFFKVTKSKASTSSGAHTGTWGVAARLRDTGRTIIEQHVQFQNDNFLEYLRAFVGAWVAQLTVCLLIWAQVVISGS